MTNGNNKKDPLLVESGNSNGGNSAKRHQQSSPSSSVRHCIHGLFCFLPLLGGSLLLAILGLLLFSSPNTIFDQSISKSLSSVEPYIYIMVPVILASTIIFIVTIVRNIQIRVYFTRYKQYQHNSRWVGLNIVSTAMNIVAYIAFILLSVYRIDSPNRIERDIHFFATSIYFILSSGYCIIQSLLLTNQVQYPTWVQFIMALGAVFAVITATTYAITDKNEYEWIAVTLQAIYIICFTILFHIDPVDDELITFFQSFCR